MEEAGALASRAGILATRMLALGTADHLRRKYSNTYTIHLVTRNAPHSTESEMDVLRKWVLSNFQGAVLEERSLYGQLKFSVLASSPTSPSLSYTRSNTIQSTQQMGSVDEITEIRDNTIHSSPHTGTGWSKENAGTALQIFNLLEEHKELLNLNYYSVSPSALEEVFLEVISRHNVLEEGHENRASRISQWSRKFHSWFLLKS